MRGTWKRLIRPIILVAVSLLAGRIVIGLVGSVDWGQVWSALGRLSWSAVPVLILLLLVRQAAEESLQRLDPEGTMTGRRPPGE